MSENLKSVLPGYDEATNGQQVKSKGSRHQNNEPHKFIEILEQALPRDYASFRYVNNTGRGFHSTQPNLDHIPDLPDTVAHLKFLRSLGELKKTIVGIDNPDHLYTIKNWQVFVTQAVKRFVTFVTACQKALNLDRAVQTDDKIIYYDGLVGVTKETEFLDGLLPPLDVLMVWHAFLLNPRAFYDTFARNNFIEFALFPFPLKRISDSIDNHTFAYNPDEKLRTRYLETIALVTTAQEDMIYSFSSFSMFEPLISVHCPQCQSVILKDIPYTNDSRSGFADETFSWRVTKDTLCNCNFVHDITHDELRKRQLYSDAISPRIFPGTFRYFSGVISKRSSRARTPSEISDTVKKEFTSKTKFSLRESSLEIAITTASTDYKSKAWCRILLGPYFSANIVHSLIPNPFRVNDDLVGCVMRQERFVEKMNTLDWLHSPVIRSSLYESSIRYSRFFKLLTYFDSKRMLVPTLDIDLVWHTHQLSMRYYFEDCLSSRAWTVIDHDDKVEESRLDDGFEYTSKVYRKHFGEDYSICFCWYCVTSRSNAKPTFRKMFRKKDEKEKELKMFGDNPLFVNQLGLTHISLHNAVSLPTKMAQKKHAVMVNKYKGQVLPWRDDTLAYSYYPMLFVVAPSTPFLLSQCEFSNQALCCTVRDSGYNCQGMGNCAGSGCSSSGFTSGCSSVGSSSNCGGGGGGCGGGS